jgi:hypothetical protein
MTSRRAVVALVVVAGVVLSGCGARQQEPTAADHTEPPQSEQLVGGPEISGAVETAVGFVLSGQRLLDTAPVELGDLVQSMWSATSADDALDATLDRLAALRARIGAGVGPTRFRQAVLAVRVDSSSSARVVVSVWWVGVLSRADAVTPQAQWSTSTVTMVSESGEWKVDAESTEAGPLPDHSVDSEPIAHVELERRLAGFVDWGGR